MHIRHQQTIAPHGRLERLRRPAIDGSVLADHGAFSDFHGRFLTRVFQILRRAAEYGSHPDLNVGGKRDVSFECCPRRDDASAGNRAALADYRIRPNFDIRRQLGVGRYQRGRVDPRHHRSRTMAAMSASATTSPSTLPTPRILQTIPRIWMISSSNMI